MKVSIAGDPNIILLLLVTQLSLKQMLIINIGHLYTIINDILSVARVEKIVDVWQL